MSKVFILLFLAFAASLPASINVVAISGSMREDSANKKLVFEAGKMASQMNANVTYVDLKDYPMPFFDADLEKKEGMPPSAVKLQQLLSSAHVIIIASPEYNSSISAVLKNSIDWVSREKIHRLSGNAFKGKQCLMLSASPGRGGGTRGLVHLRVILEEVGCNVLKDQFNLPNAYTSFDQQGNLKDANAKAQLKALVQKALN